MENKKKNKKILKFSDVRKASSKSFREEFSLYTPENKPVEMLQSDEIDIVIPEPEEVLEPSNSDSSFDREAIKKAIQPLGQPEPKILSKAEMIERIWDDSLYQEHQVAEEHRKLGELLKFRFGFETSEVNPGPAPSENPGEMEEADDDDASKGDVAEPEADDSAPDDGLVTTESAPELVAPEQGSSASTNFLRKDHLKAAQSFRLEKIYFYRQIAVFAIMILAVLLVFQGAKIVSSSLKTKDQVLGTATQALSNLKEAAQLVQQKNFTGSAEQLEQAQDNFGAAKTSLNNMGLFLNSLLYLTSQGKSASAFLDAGQHVTRAGLNLNSFYSLISSVKVTALGFSAPDGFYDTLGKADTYLQSSVSELNIASADLDNVDPAILPTDLRDKYVQYHDQLGTSVKALSEVSDMLNMARIFFGPGKKTVLVLFENSHELRANGGFIGTYGIFHLNDGQITSQHISSIYDLDGQLKEKIAPPGPFQDLTDHWGIRDSNWFADFKQSANKATYFYQKETGETPDAVVAITPQVFVDLLKITGPIDFPKYNVTLNADNFIDTVQFETSENYDKVQNTPKQMLADFAPLFLQRLYGGGSGAQMLSAILQNLAQKDIQFYDSNPDTEKIFQDYNWAGQISETQGDYISIVNSNLGGKKTDGKVQQKALLESSVQADGSVVNTLTYTRNYAAGPADKDKNIDYLRVLVPEGSTFISASGYTKRPFYHSDGTDYKVSSDNFGPFEIDPDLAAIDQKTVIDAISNTAITREAGKTEFGNWVITDPGSSSTVVIKYKLPFKATDQRTYSLLVQRQPGNAPIDFTYSLEPQTKVLWYTPDSANVQGGALNFKQSLTSDIFVGAVLDN